MLVFHTCLIKANAQKDSLHAPYLLSQGLPTFNLSKAPDSTSFSKKDLNKDLPVIFIVFNPDCEFCQHETRDLIKNIDKFRNVQIVMVSYMPFDLMLAFYNKYNIAKYPNITMAHDGQYTFLKFFQLKLLPATIVYDKRGRFKKIFRERADMKELAEQISTLPLL